MKSAKLSFYLVTIKKALNFTEGGGGGAESALGGFRCTKKSVSHIFKFGSDCKLGVCDLKMVTAYQRMPLQAENENDISHR